MPLAWLTAGFPWWASLLVIAAITAVGIWSAAIVDGEWGTHDSGRIVIDEVAGYFVTVLAIDRGDFTLLACGFVLFRAFDIVKPPPVRWVDRHVGGGAGVVLDDIAAGVLACVALYGLSLTALPARLAALLA